MIYGIIQNVLTDNVTSVLCFSLTLHACLHRGAVAGHRETVAHVINFAHVCIEKLEAGGEGHPLQLCYLPFLLRQAFVPKSGC